MYAEMHESEAKFKLFCNELRYETYQNSMKMSETFKWIKEAEEELHGDPDEAYHCVLANFGGSATLTFRIIEPNGGIIYKIKAGINRIIFPKTAKWYILSNINLFIMLCLHILDYVKDTGKINCKK